MSQTPTDIVGPEDAAGYMRAWQAIQDWTAAGKSWSGHEKNCCFLNNGNRTFSDISAISGLDLPDDARGVAIVDWDHDGRLDLWISARSAPQIRFFRNQAPQDHHFFALRLQGVAPRDAIGATVTLRQSGKPLQSKTLSAGQGFLSQSSKWLHFGLSKDAVMEAVKIAWPDGTEQTFTDVTADQHYLARQGDPQLVVWKRPQSELRMAAAEPILPTPTSSSAT